MYILNNFHGLHTLNEAFLHRNPELLGLGKKIRKINSGAFGGGYLLPNYQQSLVHFFIIQLLFLQKTKPLYPHTKKGI